METVFRAVMTIIKFTLNVFLVMCSVKIVWYLFTFTVGAIVFVKYIIPLFQL